MRAIRSIASLLAPAGLALAASGVPAAAQAPGGAWQDYFSMAGAAAGDAFGFRASGGGDVDGDGVPDLVVGAPLADPGGRVDAGSAYVYSGATGQLIAQWDGVDAGDQFGASVAILGDVNNDGKAEVIVGAPLTDPFGRPNSGTVYLISGGTGASVWRTFGLDTLYLLGFSVASAGDTNGDMIPDVVAGAPYAAPFNRHRAGSVFVYSGLDGTVLRRIDGANEQDQLGYSVDGVEDANFDGLRDVIAGAPYADANGLNNSGVAYLVSVATGQLLVKLQGTDRNGFLGFSVAGVGDLDLDGRGDVICGIPGADQSGKIDVGRARVFSGFKGAVLVQVDGAKPGDQLGYNVGGPGDVTGDSFPDFLVGAPFVDAPGMNNVGMVGLYSGFDGTLYHTWSGAVAEERLGISVDGAGDLNDDGLAELIIGSPKASPSGLVEAGATSVHGFDPFLRPDGYAISSSAGGTVVYTIDFPVSEAGASYLFLASASGFGPSTLGGIQIPLTQDGVFGMTLNQSYPPGYLTGGSGTLDPNGDGTTTLVVPPGGLSRFIASYFHVAVVSSDAGGYRLSTAGMPLRIRM